MRSLRFSGATVFVGLWLLHSLGAGWVVHRATEWPNAQVSSIAFGFGPLVHNLLADGTYSARSVFENADFRFSAHRMPLIPFFLATAAQLHSSLLAVYLLKNLIFGAALWGALYGFWSMHGTWRTTLIGLFAFSFPQLSRRFFDVHTEEGYLCSMIALLFVGLITLHRAAPGRTALLGLGALNAALYLTKSSMLPLAIAFCLLYGWITRDVRVAVAFALLLGLAIAGWGGVNLARSGHFPIGTSWDGWNLRKGHNERVLDLYPRYSLDLLDREGLTTPERRITNEWAFDDYQKQHARRFALAHPVVTAESTLRKAGQMFLEIRPNGLGPGRPRIDGAIRIIGVACMLVFRLLLVAAVGAALWIALRPARARTEAEKKQAVGFLAVIVAYSVPYVVGFGYERHVMPMVLPTLFFLAAQRGELLLPSPRGLRPAP